MRQFYTCYVLGFAFLCVRVMFVFPSYDRADDLAIQYLSQFSNITLPLLSILPYISSDQIPHNALNQDAIVQPPCLQLRASADNALTTQIATFLSASHTLSSTFTSPILEAPPDWAPPTRRPKQLQLIIILVPKPHRSNPRRRSGRSQRRTEQVTPRARTRISDYIHLQTMWSSIFTPYV